MQKNVGSQKLIVFVWNSTTGNPVIGTAANLTAYVSIDYGSVTVLGDTSATELSSSNAPGYYSFDLTQGETNGNFLLFTGKSSVSNEVVVGVPAGVQTVPASFVVAPGSSGALLVGGSNAATTIAGLTTGAIAATTITASGAVAFQSTFAVTTSTALAALSCTTLTASGAVAFQSTLTITGTTTLTGAVSLGSTLGVTGTTTLAAVNTGAVAITGTLSTSGTATFNALTVTNATTLSGAVSLGSTLGVSGTTTFAAINTGAIGTGNITITGTLSTSGTVTFNAMTVTNAFTVSGATTHTGAFTATNAGNDIRGVQVASLSAAGITAVEDAVWDTVLANHLDAGSTGFALNAAGSAGDPWGTALPGAYGVGTAGHIIGTALPDIAPGSANGLLRGGTNTATTIAGLTTGAIAATTITASGAVAFQSTFAVTGTTTFTGAVSLGSTLGVTGTTTFAAVNTGAIGTGNVTITGTLSTSGTATFNALTVTNLFTINGTSNVPQTGDSFARIGATGSGLTSLAPSSTALSTAQWSNTLATNLGTTNTTVSATLDTTVSSRASATVAPSWYTSPTTPPTTGAIATAVWQDATAGDFTTAGSIGKSLFTSGNVPGAASGLALVGSAATLAAGALTDTALATSGANRIADTTRRRTQANLEASAYGDTLSLTSLYGFVQQAQESDTTTTPGLLTVMKTDGTTVLGTRVLATDAAAEPVVGVN